jgi:dipeptidase E
MVIMKGKFVIYSGGSRSQNNELNQALVALCGQSKSITYIPVTKDQDPKYYQQFKKYYSYYGFNKFEYLALDQNNSASKIKKALSSSAIYLDGGNTYHFLKNIHNSNFKSLINYFLNRGGIVAGQSAGSINLSPNIKTASVPSLDADEPIAGFNRTKALSLIPFEFSPHFSSTDKRSIKELKEYSKITKNEIFACDDGSGIVINSNVINFYGRIYSFKNGIFSIKN